jgi:hypothetical protein
MSNIIVLDDIEIFNMLTTNEQQTFDLYGECFINPIKNGLSFQKTKGFANIEQCKLYGFDPRASYISTHVELVSTLFSDKDVMPNISKDGKYNAKGKTALSLAYIKFLQNKGYNVNIYSCPINGLGHIRPRIRALHIVSIEEAVKYHSNEDVSFANHDAKTFT